MRSGLIPAFEVAGPVTVSNAQPASEAVTVESYGGNSLTSSLKDVTEVMVQQMREEIGKNGKLDAAGAPKSLTLKVDSLRSRYIAFYFKSTIEFDVQLGDGQLIHETVHHSSGVLPQDLDGCIAEGVMVALNDARIRTYLAH